MHHVEGMGQILQMSTTLVGLRKKAAAGNKAAAAKLPGAERLLRQAINVVDPPLTVSPSCPLPSPATAPGATTDQMPVE
ncbi:MAG: hypothetical protein HYV34_02055 [Candidatus Kerfeldbacteria bacterium]|nr:hypothetical protein [Candidatus Kerfeldbacteria bacterium]